VQVPDRWSTGRRLWWGAGVRTSDGLVDGGAVVDVMALARAEREDRASFLETLAPKQWDARTLRTEWTVSDGLDGDLLWSA